MVWVTLEHLNNTAEMWTVSLIMVYQSRLWHLLQKRKLLMLLPSFNPSFDLHLTVSCSTLKNTAFSNFPNSCRRGKSGILKHTQYNNHRFSSDWRVRTFSSDCMEMPNPTLQVPMIQQITPFIGYCWHGLLATQSLSYLKHISHSKTMLGLQSHPIYHCLDNYKIFRYLLPLF